MKIFFKKRFGGEKEMNAEEALEIARFIYKKIQTVNTPDKRTKLVNNRFLGIQFTTDKLL